MKRLHIFLQKLILLTIKIYQVILSPFQVLFPTAGCRFWPSCSEYTYQAVKGQGIRTGMRMGVTRILKCNPWSS